MLSRIAESLFWIGRYIERAEDTARILDVQTQLLLEDPWIDEDDACRSLLSVMGVEEMPDRAHSRRTSCSILAVDRANPPRSPTRSGRRARTPGGPARSSRPSCGRPSTRRTARMPRRVSSDKRCTTFFQWVRERSALAVGITDATTSRDEGWQFFTLGRCIERADMTARLLATASLTRGIGPVVDDHAALVRRLRGLPAHLPRVTGVEVRGRVPAARPALPAGRWSSRSTGPSSASTTSRPPPSARASRPGPAPARPDPQRARVPPARRDARRPPEHMEQRAARDVRAGLRGDPPALLRRRRGAELGGGPP